MLYIPTEEFVNCNSDTSYCLKLFQGTISSNFWGTTKPNDYAEVFFNQSYIFTCYTLYSQSSWPSGNAKSILVQGILLSNSLVEIDKITESKLTTSEMKEKRNISFRKKISGVRFTVLDTRSVISSEWYSGLLRIDVYVEPCNSKNNNSCIHKISTIQNWCFSFIALVYS